jgi:anthranilate synthase component 1
MIDIPNKPRYKVIKNGVDIFSLFKKIENSFNTCFILESLGQESYRSRYSVIGFDPDSIVEARNDKLLLDDKEISTDNAYLELKNIIPTDILSKNYCGGLVGYISYEAMKLFEPSLNLKEHPDFGLFKFGVYTDGLVYDKMTGELFYFYYKNDRSKNIKNIISKDIPEKRDTKVEFLGHSSTKKEHKKAVDNVLEHIKAGNTFQCEVGFKSKYKISGDKVRIYESLREVNPSPHMYYLKFDDNVIIGASPELLFRMRDGEMETYPLAGTIHRGKTKQEDQALARELLNDPKEIAEHKMLIDLHRNDIGRVAKFGTVKVRKAMEIKQFSHVQHISSEIAGIIDNNNDMFSALASNFPAGTLTGAPKIESMKIIQSNENEPRGPYGGAVGHFGFNGDCTFAIPIRSIFANGDQAYAQTSGGIVLDSDYDKEYQEILNKLKGTETVLNKFIN